MILEESKDLTAVFKGLAEASVLEADQTKEGLNSMTIIIDKGTLKLGSLILLGEDSFKIKTILNDQG